MIRFVDTTYRDAHASLWAEAMTTGMMLPVAKQMDEVGFESMDFIATSHFKKCVRELREDPWERIRLVAQRITRTPLSLMMHNSITTFGLTPMSVIKLWMERIAANGIKMVQLMEPSNDMSFKVPQTVRYAREAGLKISMALIFSESPKHTDEYFAQKARDASGLDVDIIYIKDSGGLLTPERVRTLVPVILQNANGKPVQFHSHCTTGLAPLCYLEAIKQGINVLHTAIPPLANGSSQPSIFNIIHNARSLGHDIAVNEAAIKPISEHFYYVAKRERLPIGIPLEYDVDQYKHQVPGGVISNLKHQLTQLKMEQRLPEVLAETIRIRQDLGYPIMVTPFSQYVVSQAVLNIVAKERYERVTDELIQYAMGFWGEEASSAIEPNVKDRILSSPRARELANWEPPEPTIDEVRQRIGGPGISDDELLLRFIVQEEEIKRMRAAGPIKEYPTGNSSVVALIQELTRQRHLRYVSVKKGAFSLTLSAKAQVANEALPN